MIPQSVIEEIKSRCDIEQVISRYITLKRAGSHINGLCPFHSEKTPSFTVFKDTDSFYCFGCGAGGDVVSFIMRAENLSYVEALEFLAKEAGVDIVNEKSDKSSIPRARFYEMNTAAAKFFYEELKKSPEAQKYCAERRLTAPLIKHFGLGYAPNTFNSLVDHLHSLGFSDNEIVEGSLGGKSEKTGKVYDYYRGRLMFPIIDASGSVIAFSGRTVVGDERKYFNSKDTPVFKKSKNLFAFNFAKASCHEKIILCEGNMDVVSLHGAGFTNAVATLGTALTDEQARMMKRYTGEVVISYDADEAGQKAANRAFSILREVGLPCKVLKIEGAKDPDEFIGKYGVIAFKQLIDGSYTEFDYKFENILKKYDISKTDDVIKAANEIVGVIAKVTSSVEREIYIRRAANKLNTSVESMTRDVERALRGNKRANTIAEKRKIHDEARGLGDRINPDRINNIGASAAEESIIGIMLYAPEYITKCKKGDYELCADDFVTEFNRRLFVCMMDSEGEFNLSLLNEKFTQDEVARAMSMQVKRRDLENSDEAFVGSIKKLKKSKKDDNISLEDLIKRKRNGN